MGKFALVAAFAVCVSATVSHAQTSSTTQPQGTTGSASNVQGYNIPGTTPGTTWQQPGTYQPGTNPQSGMMNAGYMPHNPCSGVGQVGYTNAYPQAGVVHNSGTGCGGNMSNTVYSGNYGNNCCEDGGRKRGKRARR